MHYGRALFAAMLEVLGLACMVGSAVTLGYGSPGVWVGAGMIGIGWIIGLSARAK